MDNPPTLRPSSLLRLVFPELPAPVRTVLSTVSAFGVLATAITLWPDVIGLLEGLARSFEVHWLIIITLVAFAFAYMPHFLRSGPSDRDHAEVSDEPGQLRAGWAATIVCVLMAGLVTAGWWFSRPSIRGDILLAASGTSFETGADVLVVLLAINNSGDPTSLHDWRAEVDVTDTGTVDGRVDPNTPTTMHNVPGMAEPRVIPADSMIGPTMRTPLQEGERRTGYLAIHMPRDFPSQYYAIPGTELIVRFRNVAGRDHVIREPLRNQALFRR